MNFYITSITLLVIATLIVIGIVRNEKAKKRRKEQISKESGKSEEVKKEVKKEPVVLKEIPNFDEDSYIADTFNVIFHSLPIEKWDIEHERESLIFYRKKSDQNRRTSVLKLKVEFTFKHADGKYTGDKIFQIERISLHPPDGMQTFTFKGEVKEEYKEYFYTLYSEHKNKENASKKLKVDLSLKSINEMIGQASIRDSKLSEILGDKNEL